MRTLVACLALLALPAVVRAQDAVHVDALNVDRPTLITLGVQVLVSGDANRDASATLRYRVAGTTAFHDAPPLHRVHPETVTQITVPEQLAGSAFELAPGTAYELEVVVHDPDGGDATMTANATTRRVPGDPATPHAVAVRDVASLNAALGAATAGDVITLAAGTYAGNFSVSADGTADRPIVIRGVDPATVTLDGGGCTGCNVLEVYGSHTHVESLTIAHASRGLRFQGTNATGNVVRRVTMRDVTAAIASKDGQTDFYLCDNDLRGRLTWPSVYTDDGGLHANDDGIHVDGDGHVICHNRIGGFGDAAKNGTTGFRSFDVYGNDVLYSYDNAIELDGAAGNARSFRNRYANVFAPLSFQPIDGGPAYSFRDVVVNVVDEQMKLHANGTDELSGVYVWNDTFVSSGHAMHTSTSATSHYVTFRNDLFVGAPTDGRVIDWDAITDHADLDYDGFSPDGDFRYRGTATYATFAALVAGGVYEAHGTLVAAPVFAALTAPTTYTAVLDAPDATLADGSGAVDRGVVIPNVDDGFLGAAPDLGALEKGCSLPVWGPRAPGVDETNEPRGCAAVTPGGDAGPPGPDAGAPTDGGSTPHDAGPRADGASGDGGTTVTSGGCCGVAGTRGDGTATLAACAVVALVVRARARRRR